MPDQQANDDEFISRRENDAFLAETPEPFDLIRHESRHALSDGLSKMQRHHCILNKLSH